MTTQNLVRSIQTSLIHPNPYQTRQTVDPAGIEALADSIERDGLLQPILVRDIRSDLYELIAGQRRLMAWHLLIEQGRFEDDRGIPAIVRRVDDRQMLLDTLTENLVREDVDIIEEARAISRALDVIDELSQADLAATMDMSPGQLSNRIRLLQLPDSVLQHVSAGRMAWTTARELLCFVGDDHIHEEEIELVLKEAMRYGADHYTGPNVRRAILGACRSKRWRALESVESYGGLDPMPLFDVGGFRMAYPEKIHRIPKYSKGSGLVTCASKEWNAAQREAKASMPPTKEDLGKLKPFVKAMLRDAVAKRLGLTAEHFSGEKALTGEEIDALGTRGEYGGTAKPEFKQIGSGYSYSNPEPPKFFDRSECFDTCNSGAVYAAASKHSSEVRLFCSNKGCYTHKWEGGLLRFNDKEQKRATQAETQINKWRERLDTNLAGLDDSTARILLTLALSGQGEPVRPLGSGPGDTETRYYYDAHVRLAEMLGIPEKVLAERMAEKDWLWRSYNADAFSAKIEDPRKALVEALAISQGVKDHD